MPQPACERVALSWLRFTTHEAWPFRRVGATEPPHSDSQPQPHSGPKAERAVGPIAIDTPTIIFKYLFEYQTRAPEAECALHAL